VTSKPIIAVTRRLPRSVELELARYFECTFNPTDEPSSASALQRMLGEADGIIATVTDKLTAEVFSAYPIRTRIVANFGVGTDHIDLNAAAAHGLLVTNTPDVLTDDTADLALTLIMMALRRAGEGERELRGGRWLGWRPTHMLGSRVSGRTLGIVGLGRIGRSLARRASFGFDMKVRGWGRTMPSSGELAADGIEAVGSLDQLLATSEVVSIHVPGGSQTKSLIDSRRMALMPTGSVLVNTSRGSVVDTDALVNALVSGHLAAAGLDVYTQEPDVDLRLLGIERAVLLPHLGSATIESREAMGMMACDNLRSFFQGDKPRNLVS
jgi:lactate dehydrogenase-like 2-hydroxyacid dehydrogenase